MQTRYEKNRRELEIVYWVIASAKYQHYMKCLVVEIIHYMKCLVIAVIISMQLAT